MCGIAGMIAFEDFEEMNDMASYMMSNLTELQNRGNEGCGIYTNNDMHKGKGAPSDVFTEQILRHLGGKRAVGQTSYTTSGKEAEENKERFIKRQQPFIANAGGNKQKEVGFVFNGNLINWEKIRDRYYASGGDREIINDTGAIAALIELSKRENFLDIFIYDVLPHLERSFSLIFCPKYEHKLYAARDPYGFMPLVLGIKKDKWLIAASEDNLFEPLHCERLGEVPPGTIAVLDPFNPIPISYHRWTEKRTPSHCIFQFIYFNSPNSNFCGRTIQLTQRRAGELLAEEHPVYDADIVVPVPNSGNNAGLGYAKKMTEVTGRWYLDYGLFRSRYVDRTFMLPYQHLREEGIGQKLRPILKLLKDKKVVIVDDSIVRGTTAKKIVTIMRDAGAKEVHFRVASPPIIDICTDGMDFSTHEELAWFKYGGKEGIRKHCGADTLEYLNLIAYNKRAIIETEESYPYPLSEDSFCTRCFTGENPTKK